MNVLSRQLLIVGFAVMTSGLIWWVVQIVQHRRYEREFGKALSEPFQCEVLYQGKAVADLTDRQFGDMFWHHYRIEPRTPESKALIENDDLWDCCAFYFRDPKSGELCTTGFVGGSRPFIQDSRIWLRAMYFGGKASRAAYSTGGASGAGPAA